MTVRIHDSADQARRPSPADLALAASLLGVALLSGLFVDVARPDNIEPSAWWHWLLMATPPVLVAFRRVHPVAVTVVATVAQSGIWVSNLPEVLLPVIVILFTAASGDDRRGLKTAVGAGIALSVVTAIGVRIAADVTLYQVPLVVLTCGTAIVLGANSARQRQLALELATDIAETRLRAQHERAQAAAEERSHIARELHDTIGHTLSVIAVRAEAADRVAKSRPEAAGDAVADIASSARSALDETRRVLAGLRQSSAIDLAPAPDLDATRKLVSDLALAGVSVRLAESGCADLNPPIIVAGGVHRIVQESLTNAIKHGGAGVEIVVELGCHSEQITAKIASGLAPSDEASAADGSGTGLAGMAERVEVLGGTFSAGPVGSRFVVESAIPLESGHGRTQQ